MMTHKPENKMETEIYRRDCCGGQIYKTVLRGKKPILEKNFKK